MLYAIFTSQKNIYIHIYYPFLNINDIKPLLSLLISIINLNF